MKATRSRLNRILKIVTAAMLGIGTLWAAPSHADSYAISAIAGNGATGPLSGISFPQTTAALNDLGLVAMGMGFRNTFTRGFLLTNGYVDPTVPNSVPSVTVIPDLPLPPPTGSTGTPNGLRLWSYNRSFSINNNNEIMIPVTGVYGGSTITTAIYSTSPPYLSMRPESAVFSLGLPNRPDVNSSGQGAFWQSSGGADSLYRINGDGTTTVLPTPPLFSIGPPTEAPQIDAEGNIYVIGLNRQAPQQIEILRFAAGQTTATVAYSTTARTGSSVFAVNDQGDILVSTNNSATGGNGQLDQLTLIPHDGSGARAIAGSQVPTGNLYTNIGITSSGTISAVRSGGGVVEVLYGGTEANQPLARVIGTGDNFNGRAISSIAAVYESTGGANDVGQLLAVITTDTNVRTWVRIDPPGTSPVNPILPGPCQAGQNGYCFVVPPNCVGFVNVGSGQSRRFCYFDPDYALGYEFISQGSAFAGVNVAFQYGDGTFDLFLYSAGGYFDSGYDVLSGQYFDFEAIFPNDDIFRFALMGIEPSAQVDPNDPTGFVTALAFVSDGANSFSMVAVTGDLPPPNGVPEPGTLVLLCAALLMLAGVSRRRLE